MGREVGMRGTGLLKFIVHDFIVHDSRKGGERAEGVMHFIFSCEKAIYKPNIVQITSGRRLD